MATLLVGAPRSDASKVKPQMVIAERYRVEGTLGRGSFGAVFEATHAGTGQPVALKILSGGEQDDELALRRFFQEARVTSGLRHPNTIRVFDFGQDDEGLVYLAMERLAGRTLRQALAERRKSDTLFSEEETVEVAISITRSLSEAHSAGLVHRDLKPENVFVHEVAGDEPIVKVLDFGIVKTRGSSLTDAGPSGSLGTPAFMSPEQANNVELDGRSDLYSLGIIMYLMVSGRLPFMRETPLQTLVAHINDPLPDLRKAAYVPVSEPFVALVEKALAKVPEGRFETAAEMRAALHEVIGKAPKRFGSTSQEVTPPSVPPMAAGTLPGGGWATTPVEPANTELVPPPPEPAPPRRGVWYVAGALLLTAAVALGAYSASLSERPTVRASALPPESAPEPPPPVKRAEPKPEPATVVAAPPKASTKRQKQVDSRRPAERPKPRSKTKPQRAGEGPVHEHNPFSSGASSP